MRKLILVAVLGIVLTPALGQPTGDLSLGIPDLAFAPGWPRLTTANGRTLNSVWWGESLQIRAVIVNQGSGAAGRFALDFRDGSRLISRRWAGSLAPAGRVTMIIPWQVGRGRRTVLAAIDPTNQVQESNKGNNAAQIAVSGSPRPWGWTVWVTLLVFLALLLGATAAYLASKAGPAAILPAALPAEPQPDSAERPCPDCGTVVSTDHQDCPHCGRVVPLPPSRTPQDLVEDNPGLVQQTAPTPPASFGEQLERLESDGGCPSCGEELDGSMRFCPNCGKPVR